MAEQIKVYQIKYNTRDIYGIDKRKLEKNTGLPVLWIPL